jgi:hypothetical protein
MIKSITINSLLYYLVENEIKTSSLLRCYGVPQRKLKVPLILVINFYYIINNFTT